MEKGTLRADVNVSVRPRGADELPPALGDQEHELVQLHRPRHRCGGPRSRSPRTRRARRSSSRPTTTTRPPTALTPRRSKEEADDYRYFPEPDLVPVEPPAELVERLRAELPESPGERIRRFAPALGFGLASDVVTAGRSRLYERLAEHAEPRIAANLLMNELTAAGVEDVPNAGELAKVLAARQEIPRESFVKAVAAAGGADFRADDYLAEKVVSDTAALGPIVDEVLAANPGQVEQYRSGKEGLLGFLVGQVMKQTGGKASPQAVNELLREKLKA